MVAADPGLAAAPMWWSAGRIVSKNPSDAVSPTMREVAEVLEAGPAGPRGLRAHESGRAGGAADRLSLTPLPSP